MATVTTNNARPRDAAGIRRRVIVDITGPSSYTAGGDPFVANEVFLGKIEFFPSIIALNAAGAAPRLVVYDYTNETLQFFVPNTGNEVAGGTDLSGYTFRVECVGK